MNSVAARDTAHLIAVTSYCVSEWSYPVAAALAAALPSREAALFDLRISKLLTLDEQFTSAGHRYVPATLLNRRAEKAWEEVQRSPVRTSFVIVDAAESVPSLGHTNPPIDWSLVIVLNRDYSPAAVRNCPLVVDLAVDWDKSCDAPVLTVSHDRSSAIGTLRARWDRNAAVPIVRGNVSLTFELS